MQVKQARSSVAMEKEGLRHHLDKLLDQDVAYWYKTPL